MVMKAVSEKAGHSPPSHIHQLFSALLSMFGDDRRRVHYEDTPASKVCLLSSPVASVIRIVDGPERFAKQEKPDSEK
jgi:hypothetical protein